LRGFNATLEDLNGSLHSDGLDGESVHLALRETAAALRIEASRIAEKIQKLNEEIKDLESRF
jgi:predicted nuclease with TOPRIM domain